jgi:hypothetical protein
MDVKDIYCIKCKKHTSNENLIHCITRKKKSQKIQMMKFHIHQEMLLRQIVVNVNLRNTY